MTRTILLATIGALGCLTNWCGPARASTTTEAALAVACPGHEDLAPHVDAAARRYMLHPVNIVALMHVESRCQAHAVSRCGAIGLLQVLPYGPAANGLPRARLRDPRTNIETGARWLSMMTTWCGGLREGLGAYNSGKCHRSKGFARRVLATERRIWLEMARRREMRT